MIFSFKSAFPGLCCLPLSIVTIPKLLLTKFSKSSAFRNHLVVYIIDIYTLPKNCTHSHKHTHTHTYIHTYTHTPIHTHTHPHTLTHTYTHIHTHTHYLKKLSISFRVLIGNFWIIWYWILNFWILDDCTIKTSYGCNCSCFVISLSVSHCHSLSP